MKIGLKLPSLSITRGELPTGAGGLRPLVRRLRGYVGWAAVSLAFFMVFAWLSLPTRAIAWRIGHEAKKAGYIVDVEDVSVSLLGNITLENVAWTFEPSRPDQIPSKFFIKEVEIDISILSLLIGNLDIEVEARRDEGIIIAEYSRSSSESEIHVSVEELPLYDVPKAYQALNAPLMGYFALKIDLVMPDNKFSKAEGAIEVTCAACKIGDGIEKLYIPGSKGLKDGTVIPEIDLGTFVGKLVVEKGTAKTDAAMATTSEDIELTVEGNLKLKDPFPKSRLDLTVKVNLSDALQARSEKLRLVFQSADVKSRLDPPEKGLGYVLGGTIGNPSFRGIKSKTARDSRADKRARQKKRDETKRKKEEAKLGGGGDDRGDETKFEPRPALPGGAMPPSAPGEAGMQPGTPPSPVRPGENPLDVENGPPAGTVGGGAVPPPSGEPPAPVEPPPPVEQPPAEPQPEPTPEPPPPEEAPPEELPSALPPEGNFGGSGGPVGEAPQ